MTSLVASLRNIRIASEHLPPEHPAHEHIAQILLQHARFFESDWKSGKEPTLGEIKQAKNARERALQGLRAGFGRGGPCTHIYVNARGEAYDEGAAHDLANHLENLLKAPGSIGLLGHANHVNAILQTASTLGNQIYGNEFYRNDHNRSLIVERLNEIKKLAQQTDTFNGMGKMIGGKHVSDQRRILEAIDEAIQNFRF